LKGTKADHPTTSTAEEEEEEEEDQGSKV
jgi:hypothetical protein